MRRFMWQYPWLTGGAAIVLVFLALLPRINILGQGIIPIAQALSPVFCVAAAFGALVMAFGRRWIPAVLLLVGSLVGIFPTLTPVQNLPPVSSMESMTVLSINVEHAHAEVAALAATIKEHRVEIVVLTEVDEQMIRNILANGAKDVLPYRSQTVSAGDTAGTAILSKYPVRQEANIPLAEGMKSFDQPSVVIEHPRFGLVRVAGVHPYAPVVDRARSWKSVLGSIDTWQARHTEMPLILAGDFNASRSHPVFRELAKTFVDTASASGIIPIPTWPATGPVPPFIALDHILARGLTATDWQRIKIPNTDHFAILANVASIDTG